MTLISEAPWPKDQPSECIDDSWTATTQINRPDQRALQRPVWTGSEMIVWGGGSLAVGEDTIPAVTVGLPRARPTHPGPTPTQQCGLAVKLSSGGRNFQLDLNTGGKYNPSTDSWTATSTTNAPTGRQSHTAVWTGSEMIVWGGAGTSGFLNTGGRYNPSSNSWIATNMTKSPTDRQYHTAVWTGSEMIVWGRIVIRM